MRRVPGDFWRATLEMNPLVDYFAGPNSFGGSTTWRDHVQRGAWAPLGLGSLTAQAEASCQGQSLAGQSRMEAFEDKRLHTRPYSHKSLSKQEKYCEIIPKRALITIDTDQPVQGAGRRSLFSFQPLSMPCITTPNDADPFQPCH